MAFRFRRDDPRGDPKIVEVEGRWEASAEYFTDSDKLPEAQAWCRWANSGPYLRRLIQRPTTSFATPEVR